MRHDVEAGPRHAQFKFVYTWPINCTSSMYRSTIGAKNMCTGFAKSFAFMFVVVLVYVLCVCVCECICVVDIYV